MTRVVVGVLVVNGALTAVGMAWLRIALVDTAWRHLWTWSGVALLVGTALVGALLCAVASTGVPVRPIWFALVSVALLLAGLVAAALIPNSRRRRLAPSTTASAAGTPVLLGLAVLGACCVILLVAAFRADTFLDDTWRLWLLKGRVLDLVGAKPSLFVPSFGVTGVPHPEYPLLWSILTNADMRATGHFDLRAINGQIAVMLVAFIAAVIRLLWNSVPRWTLWVAGLVLLASPELVRQAHSGGADIPVAIFVALFVLCSLGWIFRGSAGALVLAGVFAIGAILLKREGGLQVGFFTVVLLPLALSQGWRRAVGLAGAAAVGVVSNIPWDTWQRVHHVSSVNKTSDALNPSFLLDRTHRLSVAATELRSHYLGSTEWRILLAVSVVTCLVWTVRSRWWVAVWPLVMIVLSFGLWLWVYWGGEEIVYVTTTSSYRVVDGVFLALAALLPVTLAGALGFDLRRREPREDRDLGLTPRLRTATRRPPAAARPAARPAPRAGWPRRSSAPRRRGARAAPASCAAA